MNDRKVPKAEIDPEATTDTPKSREEVFQKTQRPEIDTRAEPQADGSGWHDSADVPAGPGDAGAQDSPRALPRDLQRDRGGWGRVAVILGICAVIALVAYLV